MAPRDDNAVTGSGACRRPKSDVDSLASDKLWQSVVAETFEAPNYRAEDGPSLTSPQLMAAIIRRGFGYGDGDTEVEKEQAATLSLRADPRPVLAAAGRLIVHWGAPHLAFGLLLAAAALALHAMWGEEEADQEKPRGDAAEVGARWRNAKILCAAGSALVLHCLATDWQLQRSFLGLGRVKSGFTFYPSARNRAIAERVPLAEPAYYHGAMTKWLWHGDFTTFFPFLMNRTERVQYHRRWIRVSDGERIALDWALPAGGHDAEKPVMLILHGLNGGSDEAYILDMVPQLLAEGWTCVVMIARGLMNTPVEDQLFHGARTSDVHTAVRLLQRTAGALGSPICAVGFSMGGVVLANYCGTYGSEDMRRAEDGTVEPFGLAAAVCLSGCFDCLQNSKFTYSKQLWQPWLAYQLKETFMKFADIFRRHGLDPKDICADHVVNIAHFDSASVVPFFGYKDVDEYYRDMSIAHHGRLEQVVAPLLALHALDDPIIDADNYETGIAAAKRGAENLFFCITRTGGHVGWPLGVWPVGRRWEFMNRLTMQFCDAVLRAPEAAAREGAAAAAPPTI